MLSTIITRIHKILTLDRYSENKKKMPTGGICMDSQGRSLVNNKNYSITDYYFKNTAVSYILPSKKKTDFLVTGNLEVDFNKVLSLGSTTLVKNTKPNKLAGFFDKFVEINAAEKHTIYVTYSRKKAARLFNRMQKIKQDANCTILFPSCNASKVERLRLPYLGLEAAKQIINSSPGNTVLLAFDDASQYFNLKNEMFHENKLSSHFCFLKEVNDIKGHFEEYSLSLVMQICEETAIETGFDFELELVGNSLSLCGCDLVVPFDLNNVSWENVMKHKEIMDLVESSGNKLSLSASLSSTEYSCIIMNTSHFIKIISDSPPRKQFVLLEFFCFLEEQDFTEIGLCFFREVFDFIESFTNQQNKRIQVQVFFLNRRNSNDKYESNERKSV